MGNGQMEFSLLVLCSSTVPGWTACPSEVGGWKGWAFAQPYGVILC